MRDNCHDYTTVHNFRRHENTVSHKRNCDLEFAASEQFARKAKTSADDDVKEAKKAKKKIVEEFAKKAKKATEEAEKKSWLTQFTI